MNDKEMLEMAAKAEGRELGVYLNDELGFEAPFYGEWNPLLNDGDALRLSAKLMIDLIWHSAHGETRALCCARMHGHRAVEFYTDDCMGASRRAIVCVAAGIGKDLP